MRNFVQFAEFVRQTISTHAVPGFQRARGIVKTRVDYAAVPRTRAQPELRQRFEKKHIVPISRERLRDCATHDSAADNYDIRLFDGRFSFRGKSRQMHARCYASQV